VTGVYVDAGLHTTFFHKEFTMHTIKRLITDERGLETVEYAIMTSLIVAGVIVTIGLIGTWVKTTFDDLKTELGA